MIFFAHFLNSKTRVFLCRVARFEHTKFNRFCQTFSFPPYQ